MATDNLLFQTFIYLTAAVASVPVAKRLGLGSVLGYLIAGVLIGPYVLKLVGGVQDAMHFAEFGVVMMLFLVGLELKPSVLWQLRGPIFGLGGAQMGATAVVGLGAAMFLGQTWQVGMAIGLILALSSTAIILQTLQEKGLMKTPGGQSAFSVLLFQDIAVIPILALLPLLAFAPVSSPAPAQPIHAELHAVDAHHSEAQDHSAAHEGEHGASHSLSLVDDLPPLHRALVTIGVVALIIFGSAPVLRRVFRYLALTRLREIFTAMALLVVVGISLLMQVVGLSPALGAFLAGVVLAESEYRHQLEADVEPFKGLLLGLFFITVGASLDLQLIAAQPLLILGMVTALIVLKFGIVLGLSKVFRLETSQGLLLAFALAQGGEFAFVLLNFATQNSVLPQEISALLNATVAMSMAAAPILFTINEKLVQPRFATLGADREPDEIQEHDHPVILAGFGRMGHLVGRVLRANGIGVTVLDNDADQVDTLLKYGLKSYYGDAAREDLLRLAGAETAKLLILAIDDEAKKLQIIQTAREHFPHLKIIARAEDRADAMDLLRLGVEKVHRLTLGSALDMSIDALRAMGMPAKQAHRTVRIFREKDEEALRDIAQLDDNDEAWPSPAPGSTCRTWRSCCARMLSRAA